MIVADTDVLIDFLEGRGAADRVLAELERGGLATTVINRYELLAGARTKPQRKAVEDLLAYVSTLPLDESASDLAAETWRDLDVAGLRIGMADCLIAGIALHHHAALLTRNQRHFTRVPGLVLA